MDTGEATRAKMARSLRRVAVAVAVVAPRGSRSSTPTILRLISARPEAVEDRGHAVVPEVLEERVVVVHLAYSSPIAWL